MTFYTHIPFKWHLLMFVGGSRDLFSDKNDPISLTLGSDTTLVPNRVSHHSRFPSLNRISQTFSCGCCFLLLHADSRASIVADRVTSVQRGAQFHNRLSVMLFID